MLYSLYLSRREKKKKKKKKKKEGKDFRLTGAVEADEDAEVDARPSGAPPSALGAAAVGFELQQGGEGAAVGLCLGARDRGLFGHGGFLFLSFSLFSKKRWKRTEKIDGRVEKFDGKKERKRGRFLFSKLCSFFSLRREIRERRNLCAGGSRRATRRRKERETPRESDSSSFFARSLARPLFFSFFSGRRDEEAGLLSFFLFSRPFLSSVKTNENSRRRRRGQGLRRVRLSASFLLLQALPQQPQQQTEREREREREEEREEENGRAFKPNRTLSTSSFSFHSLSLSLSLLHSLAFALADLFQKTLEHPVSRDDAFWSTTRRSGGQERGHPHRHERRRRRRRRWQQPTSSCCSYCSAPALDRGGPRGPARRRVRRPGRAQARGPGQD